jgi:hypothetical protein
MAQLHTIGTEGHIGGSAERIDYGTEIELSSRCLALPSASKMAHELRCSFPTRDVSRDSTNERPGKTTLSQLKIVEVLVDRYLHFEGRSCRKKTSPEE